MSGMVSQDLMSAQVGVLGSMLIDADCVGQALSQVSAKDFQTPEYAAIYRTFEALHRKGIPTDAITVRENLGGDRDTWGRLLADLVTAVPTAANVDEYINLLRRSATLYRLQELGRAMSESDTLEDAQAILSKAMEARVDRPGIKALTFAQGYEQFFERHDGETAVSFLEWPIRQLGQVIQAEPGNVIVIGAYPGDGKTAFALQCAAAFGRKYRVGYYSFESKKERLYDRVVSHIAQLSGSRIAANQLEEKDYRELIALKDRLAGPQVTILDAAGWTSEDIINHARAKGYELVIVDYLQQVEQPTGTRRMPDFERVSLVSRQLQQFAVSANVAVIALSQLTRPDRVQVKYKDGDGAPRVKWVQPPPSMSNLRSSGQIEQDADVILLMWREDYDLKDSARIIKVAKNRNGEALDYVVCDFDGEHQTFTRRTSRPEESGGIMRKLQDAGKAAKARPRSEAVQQTIPGVIQLSEESAADMPFWGGLG